MNWLRTMYGEVRIAVKYWLIGFAVGFKAAKKYWALDIWGRMVRQDVELK